MTGSAWKPRYLSTRMRDGDGYVRERFVLPREVARAKARTLFNRYPKPAYGTTIEHWKLTPDGRIDFTMKRLPTAD